MSTANAAWLVIILAFTAANLPWMSERIFFFRAAPAGRKRAGWRWAEWLVLYFLTGAVALGVEYRLNGTVYAQGWEFYAATLCLFLVFALPGFVYRHDVHRHRVSASE